MPPYHYSGLVEALPAEVTRIISASVDIYDVVAVVKELIDNALDARATTVAVEISSDTLAQIQVRDNGTGIAADSRSLVAHRHCTSKIHNEDDLRRVGGSSLGFRGVALSSIAATSGAMTVTTRVEGEEVATKVHIGRDGEVTKFAEFLSS